MLCCQDCFPKLENPGNHKPEDLETVSTSNPPHKDWFKDYGYHTCSLCGAVKSFYFVTQTVIKRGNTIKKGDYYIVKNKQFCIYDFKGEYITRRRLYRTALYYVAELIKFHNNPDNVVGYGVATY